MKRGMSSKLCPAVLQRSIDDIQGMRVLEEDCGTSSLSVARSHNVPFLMFGPEMWVREMPFR